MTSSSYDNYTAVCVSEPLPHVLLVEMNRPQKLNAMNRAFWAEMVDLFGKIDNDFNIHAVCIAGRGRAFTSGLDVVDHADSGLFGEGDGDTARRSFHLQRAIKKYQDSFSVIEQCHQPVIALIHGACVGGGLDLISACDIRICAEDTFFTIAEIDIGMAADVGTLQRLPKIVGNDSIVRELVYTGRRMHSNEAYKLGLVSHIYKTQQDVIDNGLKLASLIASKSPIAIAGCKESLRYTRDHNTMDSLQQIRYWNMSMLQTSDMQAALQAKFQKEEAIFAKL